MQKELPELLMAMESLLYADVMFGYRPDTHKFLQGYFKSTMTTPDVILKPLPFEAWPDNFTVLIEDYGKKRLYPHQTIWPSYSAYYGLDYAEHKFSFLPVEFYSGCALYNKSLHPVSFLVLNGAVIDPFAIISNINVECYYGINVDKKTITQWDKNRHRDKYILDVHIEIAKAALRA